MSHALSRASRADSRGLPDGTPGPSSTAASMRRSLSSVEPNTDVHMTGMNGNATFQANHSRISGQSFIQQLPTPVMNGVPPMQPMQAPVVNGTRYPDASHNSFVGRNVFAASDNPIERKYRDPGKGTSVSSLVRIALTSQALTMLSWLQSLTSPIPNFLAIRSGSFIGTPQRRRHRPLLTSTFHRLTSISDLRPASLPSSSHGRTTRCVSRRIGRPCGPARKSLVPTISDYSRARTRLWLM
jgi:hypothetical protein